MLLGMPGMCMAIKKKVPISLKFDTDLLEELDSFCVNLPFPATRTGLIETAVRRMLESEKAGKRVK